MSLKRLDLPDGQWADLLERPYHAEYLAILEASERAVRGDATWAEWAFTLGRQYTKVWGLRGDDGQAIDLKDWSKVDPDLVDAICTEAQNRWREWQAARVPLVARRDVSPRPTPGEPSPDTSPAAP